MPLEPMSKIYSGFVRAAQLLPLHRNLVLVCTACGTPYPAPPADGQQALRWLNAARRVVNKAAERLGVDMEVLPPLSPDAPAHVGAINELIVPIERLYEALPEASK